MTSRREYIAKIMHGTRLHGIATRLHPWHGLVVLNYHRIGDPATSLLDRAVFSANAEGLARQIDLVQLHADLISPADVPTVLDPSSPRGRHVLITFDDGYRDNFDLALPVLKEKGVQATFFLNSGFLDTPRLPWNDEISWIVRSSKWPKIPQNSWLPKSYSLAPDEIDESIAQIHQHYVRLHGDPDKTSAFLNDLAEATGTGRAPSEVSQELWMTWDMVREMCAAGMTMGGHTVNHPSLADETADGQAAEINGVRERLLTELGESPNSFSYPYGGKHQFTETTKSLVAADGYSHAFSFYGGFNTPGATDLYDIRRVYIAYNTTDTAIEGLVTFPQLYGLVPPRFPWKR